MNFIIIIIFLKNNNLNHNFQHETNDKCNNYDNNFFHEECNALKSMTAVEKIPIPKKSGSLIRSP
jgi:hypothetical protein